MSFNAATTLHNFCVWQQGQNVQDDGHPSHHDTALLITRYCPPTDGPHAGGRSLCKPLLLCPFQGRHLPCQRQM